MDKSLTTESVLHAFSQEIAARGGTVTDTFNDGDRLFVRSTLPQIGDAQPKDRLQAGVALKAFDGDVWVHPYVFRLVCSNGAIVAQTLASRHVSSLFDFQPDDAIDEIKEAVGTCCETEVFSNSLKQIRSSREIDADLAINLLPYLSHLSRGGADIAARILKRFFEEGDRSRFGLMNAVTSVARDAADPETRWNLEELGGAIPVAAPAAVPSSPARAARRRVAELVS